LYGFIWTALNLYIFRKNDCEMEICEQNNFYLRPLMGCGERERESGKRGESESRRRGEWERDEEFTISDFGFGNVSKSDI
jgi:hypothetical protein